jgi:hypothetical protein
VIFLYEFREATFPGPGLKLVSCEKNRKEEDEKETKVQTCNKDIE